GSGNPELQGIPGVVEINQTVDQAGCEGVSPSHTVHQTDFIPGGTDRIFAVGIVMENGAPSVDARVEALTQGDRHLVETEFLLEGACKFEVSLLIDFGCFHIGFTGLESETLLDILLIGN